MKTRLCRAFTLLSVITLLVLPIAGIPTRAQGGDVTEWEVFGFTGRGVLAAAFSPGYANDHTICVSTYDDTGSYLFCSTDNGTTWSTINMGSSFTVRNIGFSPNYVNDHTLFVSGETGEGVLRSTDEGVTWISVGPSGETVWTLAISPNYASDRTLFAGTTTGHVLRSVDGGDSWVDTGLVLSGGYTVRGLVVSPNYGSDRTVFAGMGKSWHWYSGGVYRSTNGGDTWIAINSGLPYREVWALAISPNYASDRTLFVAVWHGGVYRSTNSGNNWSEANDGQPNRRPGNGPTTLTLSPDYANDQTVFYATWGEYSDGGVYRSSDGGASWTAMNAGLEPRWIHCLAVPPDYSSHPILLAGGVRSLGGALWIHNAGRIPIVIVPGLAASWNASVLFDEENGPGDQEDWSWFDLGGWGIIDAEKDWRQLIDALENAGYIENVNYFVCFYDWRKTIDWLDTEDGDPTSSEAARLYLAECIDDARSANVGASRVYLVGHSLGGLVSRSYVQSPFYDERSDVVEVITLGSPHSGTPLAYYVWEGAEAPPTWGIKGNIALWYTLKRIKHNRKGEPGYEDDFSTIHSSMEVFQDLLPVGYDYLIDQNGNPVNWQSMHEVNSFMQDRMPPDSAFPVFRDKEIELLTVAGIGNETIHRWYVDTDFHSPSLWPDGKPIGATESVEGDGTVTRYSSIVPGVAAYEVVAKHREIPGEATELLLETLRVPYSGSSMPASPDEPHHVFVAILLSPATIFVEDAEGDVVGYYATEGEAQIVLVPDADPGMYAMRVVGRGVGTYELAFGYFAEDSIQTVDLTGFARVGSQDVYTLLYDPENPETPTEVRRFVSVDIKPGSNLNSINCNNKNGVITVAILTTEGFDATTVNHTTVTLEGASEIHVDKQSGEPHRHEEDVDGDGDIDLVFHFRLGDTDLTCDSTEGALKGETFDGRGIEGIDAIRMIDRGGGKP